MDEAAVEADAAEAEALRQQSYGKAEVSRRHTPQGYIGGQAAEVEARRRGALQGGVGALGAEPHRRQL